MDEAGHSLFDCDEATIMLVELCVRPIVIPGFHKHLPNSLLSACCKCWCPGVINVTKGREGGHGRDVRDDPEWLPSQG
jgi:hypothetical protein